MTLALEIEFLTGIAFAARGPDSGNPDWPPQPDRVFSALVATWGARGEQASETVALRWVEEQPPPVIEASESEPRTAPVAYVPPNDPRTGRSGDKTVLPTYRRRQARRFPCSRPLDPVVRFFWDATPNGQVFEILERLAADTAYVGHSTSLTRCRFLRCNGTAPGNSRPPARQIYKGRFDELRRDYERFVRSNGKAGRPRPGDAVFVPRTTPHAANQSCFSPEWLVLEYLDRETNGEMPDLRAAALVAKEIRDTLLSGYSQRGMGDSVPEEISGHTPQGNPSPRPHLAVVPLAFAGSRFADGHVLGFALVPPRESAILRDANFRKAMRSIAQYDEDEGRSRMRLRHFKLELSPTLTPVRASLDSARYSRVSHTWGTVTPIVLDRHLKKTGAGREDELADLIRQACRNIGLPQPEMVVADKHPAIEGVPSAYPSGKAPAWMRWRLPFSLANRQLTHAVIQFAEPVAGPVMIGAGRFVGLGLCLPLDDREIVR
ncbi:MAG: type I-U CRISPR-associated protein Csb2 [Acidobacteriota bacterium]